MPMHPVHLNGVPATADELAPLAFAGYAHFTAAQVRERRVRGLDLHLQRLRDGSQTLFGAAVPDDVVRDRIRVALAAAPADVSLTVTVHGRPGAFALADGTGPLDLLVRTRPPEAEPAGPLALDVVEYERVLPAVKHVGEVAKSYYLRQAVAAGFDDAAFTDRHGRLGEATIWNLAFWDGDTVVWPEAEVLGGTTMRIVRRRLAETGVGQRTAEIRLADVPALTGAVVMNSWSPGVPVRRLGPHPVGAAPGFLAALHRAYEAEPWVAP